MVSQTSSGIFSTLFKGFRVLIKYWYYFISGLALLLVLVIGVKDSIQEKSFTPFVYNVGGRIMSPDGVIDIEVEKLKNNPQTTIEPQEFTSYWEKIKFKFGKWGSHIRIFGSFLFLIGLFAVFYIILSRIGEKKFVNIFLALSIMILLQLTFVLLILYKTKTGNLPTMVEFLSSYSNLFYLIVFISITGILFLLFRSVDESSIATNFIYTIILSFFIFLFIGYYGIDKSSMEHKEILKELVPFRGVTNMIRNFDLVVGNPVQIALNKLPQINESINNKIPQVNI